MVIEEIIVIFILYVLYNKYKTQVDDFARNILDNETDPVSPEPIPNNHHTSITIKETPKLVDGTSGISHDDSKFWTWRPSLGTIWKFSGLSKVRPAVKEPSPSPPTYRNETLEGTICENVNTPMVLLNDRKLTCQDMEVVDYFLLRNNKILTSLFLHNNQIGDTGAQYLANALYNNRTLRSISLCTNQIGPEGARSLCHALQNNQTLTLLSLGYNHIGDQGTKYFADTLKTNTTLTTLYLSNNQIGDEGAQYLSDALKINHTLHTLWINTNQIGHKGIQSLCLALQNNTTLTKLCLKDNQIEDKERELLNRLTCAQF